MYKILMTYDNTEGLENLLNNPEFKVEIHPKPSPERFKELISEYDGLLIRSEVKVTADIIEAGKKLRFIGRAGTGVDNVDTKAASKKGIVVANVPAGNTISAAEHTIGLMMSLARNIPQAHQSLKSHEWKRERFMGSELQGKVLGLVGFGRIGREVAHRMISFGMKVLAFDPFVSEEFARSAGVELSDLDGIYAESDYISIHSPLNDTTRNLINADAIRKMKKGVRIVNCARGGIIDEKALSEAVREGYVKGAAIDVFAKEPPADWTIIDADNVIVTPHLAASTEEAQVKIAQEMAEVIVEFFVKGIFRNAVNVPALDWDTYKQLEPYITLSEKIGAFQSQILEGGLTEIDIEYAGTIAKYNTAALTAAFLKGLLSPILDVRVNTINAPVLVKERGIKIKESKTDEAQDYTALVSARIRTDKEELFVSGTLLGSRNPRLVRIDDLNIDVIPAGCMLFLTNSDRPGIVGQVATFLGTNNINIAGMQVGRKEQGGEAVTIINVDTCATPELIANISKFSGVNKVKYVAL